MIHHEEPWKSKNLEQRLSTSRETPQFAAIPVKSGNILLFTLLKGASLVLITSDEGSAL